MMQLSKPCYHQLRYSLYHVNIEITYEGRFFYVCRVVHLMKTVKVNAYIMNIYLERLSFYLYMEPKMHYLNDFQEVKTCLYMGHWKYDIYGHSL